MGLELVIDFDGSAPVLAAEKIVDRGMAIGSGDYPVCRNALPADQPYPDRGVAKLWPLAHRITRRFVHLSFLTVYFRYARTKSIMSSASS